MKKEAREEIKKEGREEMKKDEKKGNEEGSQCKRRSGRVEGRWKKNRGTESRVRYCGPGVRSKNRGKRHQARLSYEKRKKRWEGDGWLTAEKGKGGEE
jgi:hypothetical protein